MPMQMTSCPACDVNIFESFRAREAHVEKCIADLRDKHIRLMEAVKKIIVFNLNDIRRPSLAYDEEAVQAVWEVLGFPVAQKR